MTDPVRCERRGQVLEITIDRPKANAIDLTTSRALGDAFIAYRDDPDLRAAIITGAGERIFSAGWDLKAAAEGTEAIDTDYGAGGFAGLTELFDLDKPVIAALNGAAIGGGFEIALAADLIVAAEHVTVALPEAMLGILASGGGIVRLVRQVPAPGGGRDVADRPPHERRGGAALGPVQRGGAQGEADAARPRAGPGDRRRRAARRRSHPRDAAHDRGHERRGLLRRPKPAASCRSTNGC